MAYPPETALAYLEQARQQGRLAHAYLITGLDAAARKDFATTLASRLNSSVGRRLEEMAAHHVHLIEPQSKSRRIVVDQIRSLEHMLQQRAAAGRYKIGVIAEADRMNDQATNAFLKTLEEPPPGSLLLLLTGAPSRLLDTVLSRCLKVPLAQPEPAAAPLATPEEQELAQALATYFAHPPTPSRALALAHTYTSLLARVRDQFVQEAEQEQKAEAALYQKTTGAASWLKDRDDHFDALAQARYLEARQKLLGLIILFMADLIRQCSGHPRLAFPQFAAVIAQAAARQPLEAWLQRMQVLEDLQRAYETNVNEALAIEIAFLSALG